MTTEAPPTKRGVEAVAYALTEQGIPVRVQRSERTRLDTTEEQAWVVHVGTGYGIETYVPPEDGWRQEGRVAVTECAFPFDPAEGYVAEADALERACEYGRRVAGVVAWHRASLLEHHTLVMRDVADAAHGLGGTLKPATAPVEEARPRPLAGTLEVGRAALD